MKMMKFWHEVRIMEQSSETSREMMLGPQKSVLIQPKTSPGKMTKGDH